MHTDENDLLIAKQIAALPRLSSQQQRGKRAQKQPKQNPRIARQIGRTAPPKIHSTELDPMSAEIESTFLDDISKLSGKVRQFRRAYIQGEANPHKLPDHPRTVVSVTVKQRIYEVDGKPALYVDLKHRNTAEEKAAIHAADEERYKNKIAGGSKGKRPFRVLKNNEVILERE
jgi:hypothetical protein